MPRYAQLRAVKREGNRYKKSHYRYISRIRTKVPSERITTKFCIEGDITDVIICDNFGIDRPILIFWYWGLGIGEVQILPSFTETAHTAGRPYNSAAR